MSSKRVIKLGAMVGSTLGGCVPNLWHASFLSFSGLIFSTIGGLVGIWIAWRMTR